MSSALQLDVPELEEIIVPQLDEVEARLMEVVSNADETINPPTSHLAAAGGKRLRPMLVLLTAQLGDAAAACSQQVHDAAVAVELTHIATLYHDDVMDDAPKRRGAPSAQMVWGNSAAIWWHAPPRWWPRWGLTRCWRTRARLSAYAPASCMRPCRALRTWIR